MTTAILSLIFPSSGLGSDLAELEDILHKYEKNQALDAATPFFNGAPSSYKLLLEAYPNWSPSTGCSS
jgi:hypothetical protein